MATTFGEDFMTMIVSMTGGRSELGRVLARARVAGGAGRVHVNLAGQGANTLLHDGHAWKDYARIALAGVRRAVRAADAEGAAMLVHASFAFVRAVDRGAIVPQPLAAATDVIFECENLALTGPVPACVVRLGYLYGPQSADLRAYRTAFRLGRPYWSGPPRALQDHVHQDDAVAALLAAARPKNAGRILYATDGHPISFRRLMDAFARRVGRRTPLHLPLLAKPLARVIIREEHMQQCALPMPAGAPTPRVPGWKPRLSDYRAGLDQVIAAWVD
jgi:nucleoside-diphosphate-sugar epimerase